MILGARWRSKIFLEFVGMILMQNTPSYLISSAQQQTRILSQSRLSQPLEIKKCVDFMCPPMMRLDCKAL